MKKFLIVGGFLTIGMAVSFFLRVSSDEVQGTGAPVASGKEGEKIDADAAMSAGTLEQYENLRKEEEFPEGLSAPVRELLGLDGKRNRKYEELVEVLGRLDYSTLSAGDVAALRKLIALPDDRFPGDMTAIERNAVKWEILERLNKRGRRPPELGLQAVRMAQDRTGDPVWRDYCVQFLPEFYDQVRKEQRERAERSRRHDAELEKKEEKELAVVRTALLQAVDERDSTIAGTALLGLESLSRQYEEFDREEVGEKSLEVARDETASPLSRLTALRLSAGLAGERKGVSSEEVARIARELAQVGETVLLRAAALVTLGETGSEEDRELIESCLMDDDRQIVEAARKALAIMEAREKKKSGVK